VDDHRQIIGREMNVKLNAVSALLQGELECRQGILRRVCCRASMRDDNRRATTPQRLCLFADSFQSIDGP
jgi:hypothetical protein